MVLFRTPVTLAAIALNLASLAHAIPSVRPDVHLTARNVETETELAARWSGDLHPGLYDHTAFKSRVEFKSNPHEDGFYPQELHEQDSHRQLAIGDAGIHNDIHNDASHSHQGQLSHIRLEGNDADHGDALHRHNDDQGQLSHIPHDDEHHEQGNPPAQSNDGGSVSNSPASNVVEDNKASDLPASRDGSQPAQPNDNTDLPASRDDSQPAPPADLARRSIFHSKKHKDDKKNKVQVAKVGKHKKNKKNDKKHKVQIAKVHKNKKSKKNGKKNKVQAAKVGKNKKKGKKTKVQVAKVDKKKNKNKKSDKKHKIQLAKVSKHKKNKTGGKKHKGKNGKNNKKHTKRNAAPFSPVVEMLGWFRGSGPSSS